MGEKRSFVRTLFKVRCGFNSVDMFDDFVCGDVALYYIIIQRGVSAFKSPALTAINVVDKIIVHRARRK